MRASAPAEANFYPRPPRGGRRRHRLRRKGRGGISIHALREEGDAQTPARKKFFANFYPRPPRGGRHPAASHSVAKGGFLSTPSARRATGLPGTHGPHRRISIHALREEGDNAYRRGGMDAAHFYPRPPRGGRQQKQRENPPLLSHYIPLCTNCKEVPVKQTAKSHRYLRKRLVFRCEASGKTMCAACSHWRGIKRSAHYPAQTPGAAQHARP